MVEEVFPLKQPELSNDGEKHIIENSQVALTAAQANQRGQRILEDIQYLPDQKSLRTLSQGYGFSGQPHLKMDLDCTSKWPNMNCTGQLQRNGKPAAAFDFHVTEPDTLKYTLFTPDRSKRLGTIDIVETREEGSSNYKLRMQIQRD
jgi:hypothetical protein